MVVWVSQAWLSGLVAKTLSSVVKRVAQCISGLVTFVLSPQGAFYIESVVFLGLYIEAARRSGEMAARSRAVSCCARPARSGWPGACFVGPRVLPGVRHSALCWREFSGGLERL